MAWQQNNDAQVFWDKAARDILWRSRGKNTSQEIAKVLTDAIVPVDELPRLFRALDFQLEDPQQLAIRTLAFGDHGDLPKDRVAVIRLESLRRLQHCDVAHDERALAILEEVLDNCAGSAAFVQLTNKFVIASRYIDLLSLAQSQPESQLAADALAVLYDRDQLDLISGALRSDKNELVEKTLLAMMTAGDQRGNGPLFELLADASRPLAARRLAVKAAGSTLAGAQKLLEIVKRQETPDEIRDAIAATLSSASWPEIRDATVGLFPPPSAKDRTSLPAINELVAIEGDSTRGKSVFNAAGTCAKCHQPNDNGNVIGPDLSEVGDKLAREAMFESILFPSAAISHNYENYVIFTDDGLSYAGILVSGTDAEVKLKDEAGIIRTIPIESIEEKRKSDVSLMPANISELISKQELVDLVEYLTTLRRKGERK